MLDETMILKRVRITVVRKICYPDLMGKYENPIENPSEELAGQVFFT